MMSADYDLVILGGTTEGRTAAIRAAGYGARVALVEPPGLFVQRQQQRYLFKGLQALGAGIQRQAVGACFGLPGDGGAVNWEALVAWSAKASEVESAHYSVPVMGASGIDVVLETPELAAFSRRSKQLVVTTASRRLRSRAVLAAFGCSTETLRPLLEAENLPEKVTILGGDERAVLWAEALSGLGVQVTLQAQQILRAWDEDIRRLVRSHLVVSGVTLTNPAATHEQTECILRFSPDRPALTLLGPFAFPIKANSRLQTRHSRLFACGSVLGGAVSEAIAQHEAVIAVNNALFLPTQHVTYQSVPQGNHQFAQVGLTQAQAYRRYGSTVKVSALSSPNSASLCNLYPLPNYCKLVSAQGRLLGIHLFGSGASELVQSLAQRVGEPVERLGRSLQFAKRGLAELVLECVERSQSPKWQPGQWRRDWAENWFNWRRSR